ncbi:MAG TPA: XRE family transcriptional regulator [Steroidobacteraceae bacterium]|nr:XRE family transcriptional regulator [Steroidobacteraceae bacterium]
MATIKSNVKLKLVAKQNTPKQSHQDLMEKRIADGLKLRRDELELSVTDLAEKSGVSRAMISKIERLEASPTAALLGRLCNGLGITLSSLIASAETAASPPIARAGDQPVWRDPGTGLLRTMISPRNTSSRVEIVQLELPVGVEVHYEPVRNSYDQHLVILQGKLSLVEGEDEFELHAGDCMHSRVDVAHTFSNRGRGPCKYLVVIAR